MDSKKLVLWISEELAGAVDGGVPNDVRGTGKASVRMAVSTEPPGGGGGRSRGGGSLRRELGEMTD